jgi:hypothetical protein
VQADELANVTGVAQMSSTDRGAVWAAGMAGVLVIAAPPPSASVISIPAVLTIRPGTLHMTVGGDSLTVIDATGSGSGWRVMASASDGAAELTGFTASCASGSTCTLPVSSLDYPAQVTSGMPLLEADPGSGMGTIRYSGLQWLVTPGGSGPVVITVSVQSGP